MGDKGNAHQRESEGVLRPFYVALIGEELGKFLPEMIETPEKLVTPTGFEPVFPP